MMEWVLLYLAMVVLANLLMAWNASLKKMGMPRDVALTGVFVNLVFPPLMIAICTYFIAIYYIERNQNE